MAESREVRCYEYVTVPYEQVRALLRSAEATAIFTRATVSAADRVRELLASLRVNVGPLEIGVDVRVQITAMRDEVAANGDPLTRLEFSWQAIRNPGLFPTMEGTFSVYPLSPTETQLDLRGRYRPPLGRVGNAIDAVVGHRIAEASVLRLLRDIRTVIITEAEGS